MSETIKFSCPKCGGFICFVPKSVWNKSTTEWRTDKIACPKCGHRDEREKFIEKEPVAICHVCQKEIEPTPELHANLVLNEYRLGENGQYIFNGRGHSMALCPKHAAALKYMWENGSLSCSIEAYAVLGWGNNS
jgi:DNA-directed RNA polymerase subunit RPC12/RpoP